MSRTKVFSRVGAVVAAVAIAAGLTAVGCGGGDDNPGNGGNGGGGGESATFTDSRDGKKYRTVKIGSQTWMAENLNYSGDGSTGECYKNSPDSCAKYGRLYDWATVMGGAPSSSLNPSGVQGVCPNGWHVPSDAEWTALTDAVGGASTAGTKLKSKSGWHAVGSGYIPGTDEYGFSALPGGTYNSNEGNFYSAGFGGGWLSATERDAVSAWYRNMAFNNEGVNRDAINGKSNWFALRCMQN